jgi:Fe-S cluster assembly protein SufD
LTILKGKQHVDHNTLVSHSMPNCESHQDYKGIYSEQSKGVFNGKIYVEKLLKKQMHFSKIIIF